jgi:N-acetylglucosaminyldiphosphoundecaprenol N-acetyl-beta-D-mannosaminyltransferase
MSAEDNRFAVVNVLGVAIQVVDRIELIQTGIQWANGQGARTILYANAHSLNTACSDRELFFILNQADLVYSDGMGAALAGRLLGGRQTARLEKLTGADWIHPFCREAARVGVRVFILAGRPGIAERASNALQSAHPGLQVVGTWDGFFSSEADASVLEAINFSRAQVVFVGMGTPRQEMWISRRREQIGAPLVWGVGALFDYIAGVERRCPAWMSAFGLEWLWRLMMDPGGKWRRYLVGNPLFAGRVLRQALAGRIGLGNKPGG